MDDSPILTARIPSKSRDEKGLEENVFDSEERAKVVFIRKDNEVHAMNGLKRVRAMLVNRARSVCSYCFQGETLKPPRHRHNRQKKKMDEITPDHIGSEVGIGGVVADVCNVVEDDDDGAIALHHGQQYRLASTIKGRPVRWQARLISFLCCCGLCSKTTNESVGMGPGVTRGILHLLHWVFRVNIVLLFSLMCFLFFVFCGIFAVLILLAGNLDPHCVRIGAQDFAANPMRFFNAFILSWTTFGTVGYGSIYPALSNQFENNHTHCFYVSAICSLESLMGMIYAGFCGAVLFGKVLRYKHHAQVIFSDPIVIKYGSGVEEYDDPEGIGADNNSKEGEEEDNSLDVDSIVESISRPRTKIPLPVLEFRIVNALSGEPGGEIIDATLNVVANVDANDVDPSLRDALDPAMRLRRALAALSAGHGFQSSAMSALCRPKSRENSWSAPSMHASRPRSRQHSWSNSENLTTTTDSRSEYEDFFSPPVSDHPHLTEGQRLQRRRESSWGSTRQMAKFFDPFGSFHPSTHGVGQDRMDDLGEHKTVDEDPTSNLVTKRIFSKMRLEASEHPLFKRVWLARHVLDEHSPLLKPKVRRHIRRNGGFWPDRLNSHEGVRQSLKFNQILVSLKGVSNVSAADVFAQKIYDFVDLSVGYRFVNIFFSDSEGHIQVDKDLVNDVTEQRGGGGEPLDY